MANQNQNTVVKSNNDGKTATVSQEAGNTGLKVKTNLKCGWILRRPNHNQSVQK